ncbi:hypothetical protein MRB53_038425 [Persea americana]|nr:hypothetical protein MRB53_038425 [Persea americana]
MHAARGELESWRRRKDRAWRSLALCQSAVVSSSPSCIAVVALLVYRTHPRPVAVCRKVINDRVHRHCLRGNDTCISPSQSTSSRKGLVDDVLLRPSTASRQPALANVNATALLALQGAAGHTSGRYWKHWLVQWCFMAFVRLLETRTDRCIVDSSVERRGKACRTVGWSSERVWRYRTRSWLEPQGGLARVHEARECFESTLTRAKVVNRCIPCVSRGHGIAQCSSMLRHVTLRGRARIHTNDGREVMHANHGVSAIYPPSSRTVGLSTLVGLPFSTDTHTPCTSARFSRTPTSLARFASRSSLVYSITSLEQHLTALSSAPRTLESYSTLLFILTRIDYMLVECSAAALLSLSTHSAFDSLSSHASVSTAATSNTDSKLDLSPGRPARDGLLSDSVFPTWRNDLSAAASPEEMQKKDPLGIQIWKLYSRNKDAVAESGAHGQPLMAHDVHEPEA